MVLAIQVSLKFTHSIKTLSSSTTQNSSRSSRKNFCNYCKKYGHIISKCHRLQSKQSSSQNTIFQPVHTSAAATIEESFDSTSPKFSMRDIKLYYSNFSHIQILVNLPHKFYLSPQVLLRHGILIMPVVTI